MDQGDTNASILEHQISRGEIFFSRNGNIAGWQSKDSLIMTVEDEFRLLEYTELQEARASSRSATLFAAWALGISILSTLASIGFSVFEILSRS